MDAGDLRLALTNGAVKDCIKRARRKEFKLLSVA